MITTEAENNHLLGQIEAFQRVVAFIRKDRGNPSDYTRGQTAVLVFITEQAYEMHKTTEQEEVNA